MIHLHFTDESADRREEARTDPVALEKLMKGPEARFMLLHSGRVKVVQEPSMALDWQPWRAVNAEVEKGAEIVHLGTLGGVPRFAVVPAEIPQTIETRPREVKADGDFVGVFQAGAGLSPPEAQLAAQATHFANWINRSRHCGRCGAPMQSVDGGHRRLCTNQSCKWQEFPRTDPVVLALVTRGDRCILARQPRFPPGFYSPLAGFVAPAETIEAAVRREVHEEVGVRVGPVTYLASQPWPFPGSLMMGFVATALDDALSVDKAELEDAQWFDHAEVAALQRSEPVRGKSLNLPPPGVVARLVIDHWMSGGKKENG